MRWREGGEEGREGGREGGGRKGGRGGGREGGEREGVCVLEREMSHSPPTASARIISMANALYTFIKNA